MILVEFASSGYSKGASLNAGVSFLWESTESLNEMLSYDYECQVITSYVEYKNDDEAFQNGIEKLAKKALEKVDEYRKFQIWTMQNLVCRSKLINFQNIDDFGSYTIWQCFVSKGRFEEERCI